MIKEKWAKVVAAVLGMALVGTCVITAVNSNLIDGVVVNASAATTSSYKDDFNEVNKAYYATSTPTQNDISHWVNYNGDGKIYSTYNQFDDPNGVGSMPGVINRIGWASMYYAPVDENNKIVLGSDFDKDWAALTDLYHYFSPRFSSEDQATLANLYQAANDSTIATGKKDAVIQFGQTLSNDVSQYGPIITTVKTKSSKSTISKLNVKKTASKKYVKVTGTAKLAKKANYARIKTYKGYRYAKLNSKHQFNKTIYAPKAKTVKVVVGNYVSGHFKAVTATKTVHVK